MAFWENLTVKGRDHFVQAVCLRGTRWAKGERGSEEKKGTRGRNGFKVYGRSDRASSHNDGNDHVRARTTAASKLDRKSVV